MLTLLLSLRPWLCGISGLWCNPWSLLSLWEWPSSWGWLFLICSPTHTHTYSHTHAIMPPNTPHITSSLQGLLISKDRLGRLRFTVQLFRLQLFSIHASDCLVKLGWIMTDYVWLCAIHTISYMLYCITNQLKLFMNKCPTLGYLEILLWFISVMGGDINCGCDSFLFSTYMCLMLENWAANNG